VWTCSLGEVVGRSFRVAFTNQAVATARSGGAERRAASCLDRCHLHRFPGGGDRVFERESG
jgi:hypothetical protein